MKTEESSGLLVRKVQAKRVVFRLFAPSWTVLYHTFSLCQGGTATFFAFFGKNFETTVLHGVVFAHIDRKMSKNVSKRVKFTQKIVMRIYYKKILTKGSCCDIIR